MLRLLVKRTPLGLVPVGDASYEDAKKLKMGESYEVTVKRPRNLAFHRKYFCLINTAWEYQTEDVQKQCFGGSIELFRKTILLNTGFCERVYSYTTKGYVDIPKSIAFNKMDADEFETMYSATLDFIIQHLLPTGVSREEFEAMTEELLKNY